MEKKDLFHKIQYTEKLEIILEKKDFSSDVKNLLLNMLYKIENSYNDYETVKRIVDSKNIAIEEILTIISECNSIEIIKPTSPKINSRTKVKFKVDQKNKSIEVEPNEKSLLYALYNLPIQKRVYLSEEYSGIRNALPYVLKEGKNIGKAEVIRDFDAWSWNTIHSEIVSVETNLIYQNLAILVGKEFLEQWMQLEQSQNSIEVLKQKIQEVLEVDDTNEFINLIFKLAIIIYCKKDKDEENRILEELEYTTSELAKLSDTQKFIRDISEKKVECINRIKEIDQILNDTAILKKELKKQNKNHKDKGLTEEEFIKYLKKQRKKAEKEMQEANQLLEPKKLANTKRKVEQQNKILIGIKEHDKKEEFLLEVQKYFLKGLKNKIENASTRKEIIELMYLLRYYKFIPYLNKKYIKDIAKLKEIISDTENIIIDKLIEMKIVNKFSNDIEFDRTLVKKVFEIKLMALENIYIQFEKQEKIKVILYDVKTVERVYEIDSKDVKVIKYKKKIKMFI